MIKIIEYSWKFASQRQGLLFKRKIPFILPVYLVYLLLNLSFLSIYEKTLAYVCNKII